MRPVDLTTLRQRVRRRTDTENEIARFPDTELDDAINEGIAQFHAERVRIRGQGFDEATTLFSTVAGTETYDLPATLLNVVKVWTKLDGAEFQLTGYEEPDTDGLVEPASWAMIRNVGFRIVGSQVSLRPIPDAVHTVYIKYVSTAVKLTAPSNTVDGVDGLEEFIVAWAGKRFAMKNEASGMVAMFDNEMVSNLDRLRALEHARNAANPPRMQDVRPSPLLRYRIGGRRWR